MKGFVRRLKLDKVRDDINSFILKRQVRNTNFTIIANNCWGSRIYQELGFKYNTPFVGLFFVAPCYIRLLGNLEHYFASDLQFVNQSKYRVFQKTKDYPVALIGKDVEIHFRHYSNEHKARQDWFRRLRRMNMDNLFVAFSDRDIFSEELLQAFDALPFKQKVCFTAKRYPGIQSAVYLPEYEGRPFIGDIYAEHQVYKRHFDVADWLNGGTGRIRRRTLISSLYSRSRR